MTTPIAAPSPFEHEALTAERIARLDRPGPRYTSYPTAPVFAPSFSVRAYEDALAFAGQDTTPLSLYVHLPFCESMCTYCACNVVVRKDIRRAAAPYVTAILQEADLLRAHLGTRRPVAQLHLGGGTPNYLTRPQLERLLDGLKSRFTFLPDAELALEVDPRHVDEGQLAWLAALGFSRVSLGLQDVEEEVQTAIGRMQSFACTATAFEAARAAGFRSINVDLVYGLPAQTRESFARTVDRVVGLGPDRLAIFSFAYVPSHKPQQKKLPMSRAPDALTKAQLLLDAMQRLTSAGYVQVGMDHFARPGDPLAKSYAEGTLHRNFQGYVPGPALDLLALGTTAIGDIGGVYVQNQRKLGGWQAAIDEGILPVERGWTRTFEDEVRRAVIGSLMCRFRLSFRELAARFGIEHDSYFGDALPGLDDLVGEGLIDRTDDGIVVTDLGRLFVRNVAMVYDAYLPRMRESFSRTV
jgi:oxygen-independent coproporphyrinogen III oxidase